MHDNLFGRISTCNDAFTKNIKGKNMRKKISDKQKVLLAFLLLMILSIISDVTQESAIADGMIDRAEIGGKKEEVVLQLELDGKIKDYVMEITPTLPTKEEAEKYFEETIVEIDRDFLEFEEVIPKKDAYLSGVVKADWNISPRGYLDESGRIRYEKLDADGELMQVSATLSCGSYERLYKFSFMLLPKELSQDEKNMLQLEAYLKTQQELEGSTKIELPTRLGNTELKWSQKKEYITPKIILLEIVALILLWLAVKEKHKKDEQKKQIQMEREYPAIVNQLSFLLGAGMTIRQAWNRISVQYVFKKKESMVKENIVYEAILRMNRRFAEGESERAIYQQFMQEISTGSYRRLMLTLLGSTEKGMMGICERLEEESRLAYEQRVIQAKKLGEEASAKMLLPLMLMLMVVMGIVILPALIGFQL